MSSVATDTLAEARDALTRQDWAAAFDAASVASSDDAAMEAERADLLADAAWWLGRLDDCIDARERAYQLFLDLGRDERAGRCALWLFEHYGMKTRPATANAWLQRARRVLHDHPDTVEHGALLQREAETAHGAGRLDDAAEYATAAVALGRRLGSRDLEAEALQTLGRVLIDAGQVDQGLALLDEAMLLAVEGRLGPYATGKVYCSLVSACEELGDLRRAAEWTEATSEWAQQHPLAIFPGICRIHRAVVLDRQGALAEAEQEASQAAAELLGRHPANAAGAFADLGDIRRRLGDLPRAEEAFARAEQLSGRTCGSAALLRLAQGRLDDARRMVSACLAEPSPNPLGRSRLLPAATQIAIATGDLDTARACVEELESIATAFDLPMLHASARVARARVLLADGEPLEASTALREAIGRWQDLDVPYEIATAQTILAQALREAGDATDAREMFGAARALFDQIGARLDAAGIAEDRSPRKSAGLTEREVEVLQLVAAGRSNKDIAAELHLSIKTVSRHLSNIFTKIGVSSRAAATAFAFEHDLVARR